MTSNSDRALVLTGLDGANPLGFMAALGCLRMLESAGYKARLAWKNAGTWRPFLERVASESRLLEILEEICDKARNGNDPTKELGKNITVSPNDFRKFADLVACDPMWSAFVAAFGCDLMEEKDTGRIQYTRLCFITGSGHQHFLETMRQLKQQTTIAHLERALFKGMDPIEEGLSMRWDPIDAKEYALQWSNPGPEGVRSCRGAYRLAIEALPLFPTAPVGKRLETTCFQGEDFTWPIWTDPLGTDSIRSLLTEPELQKELPDRRLLREMHVEEVYRSRRVRIGDGANFKVSFRPARPV